MAAAEKLGSAAPPAQQAEPPPILTAALAYAARGWRVLPLHGIRADGTCTCGRPECALDPTKRGKHPRTRHGVKDATADPDTLRAWWSRWPEANVGIATGGELLVLDVDGEEGQASTTGRHLPATPCVSTGRGSHYYHRPPEGVTVGNRTGLLPGLDLRGEGGYVVAPPSRHYSGAVYEWGIPPDAEDPAPCPEWLADLLTADTMVSGDRQSADLSDLLPEVGEWIAEGVRNETLFRRYACRLRHLGLTGPEITSAVQAVNRTQCKPPLPEEEVGRIVVSALRYPPGPVRIDNRLINADLADGPKALACLLAAIPGDPTEDELAELAQVMGETIADWRDELREAGLEEVARTRPTRRYTELPRTLLLDQTLSSGARLTALTIAKCRGADGVAQVGIEALARLRGKCERTVKQHTSELAQAGYLQIARAAFSGKRLRRQACNRYRFVDADSPRGSTQEAHNENRGVKMPIGENARESSTMKTDAVSRHASCRTAGGRTAVSRTRAPDPKPPPDFTRRQWRDLLTELDQHLPRGLGDGLRRSLPDLIAAHGLTEALTAIGAEEVATSWTGQQSATRMN